MGPTLGRKFGPIFWGEGGGPGEGGGGSPPPPLSAPSGAELLKGALHDPVPVSPFHPRRPPQPPPFPQSSPSPSTRPCHPVEMGRGRGMGEGDGEGGLRARGRIVVGSRGWGR